MQGIWTAGQVNVACGPKFWLIFEDYIFLEISFLRSFISTKIKFNVTHNFVLLYFCAIVKINHVLYCIVNKGLDSLARKRKHGLSSYLAAIPLPILHTALACQHIPRSADLYKRALTQVYDIICSNFNAISSQAGIIHLAHP
jgi:hypothetical protein